MKEKIKILEELINKAENIVFFGGAGVSTESNIPDFRGSSGLYNQNEVIPPETILSHQYFVEHPKEFFAYYKAKMIYQDALPNAAHYALARLEKTGKLRAIITQNIDGLHQQAGSVNVFELHGTIHKNYCEHCHSFYTLQELLDMGDIPYCPKCAEKGLKAIIKPDVVLYGEMLDDNVIEKTLSAILSADLIIVGGTSLTVNPAAGFVSYCNFSNLVIINLSDTPFDNVAKLVIKAKVGEVLKKII